MTHVVGDDRRDFDPSVADQFTSMIITTGQHNFAVNAITARNNLMATMSSLTLAVQRGHVAAIEQLTSLSPVTAAVMSNIQQSLLPTQLATRSK